MKRRRHLFPISVTHISAGITKIVFDEQVIKPTAEDFRIVTLLLRSKYRNFNLDYSGAEKGILLLTDSTEDLKKRESTLREAEADVMRWLKTPF